MRQQAKFPLMRQRADHVTVYLFKCSACERIAAFLLDEEGKLREWWTANSPYPVGTLASAEPAAVEQRP